ncbi:hypothetical protein ACRHK7_05095 [Weissella tructae]|uniref:Uncharacterized protein n=2 Tax=Weissella TaxID=46255 RepID=A0A075TW38_9LACO|nr:MULTISPECIES: hypothetical protein [Weissella]AIG65784.1 hypothetical protein WS08_0845 [Weissella tructae]AIM63163.1 hypothetical protein WS74_0911 [Weissella ceti]AIM64498.1 hypothetical protein WS105_0908 [Weissella ceti]ELA06763.1 hypothetical protein WCNC_04267 [Weissella ceti NC36]QVV90946.1 hypothetical protein KHQ32_04750 [Weissella tructae]
MSLENPLIHNDDLTQLLSHRNIACEQRQELETAIQSFTQYPPIIFVGRVMDSCVYRIGVNEVSHHTMLKFDTTELRDRFAQHFEKLCTGNGLSLQQSF